MAEADRSRRVVAETGVKREKNMPAIEMMDVEDEKKREGDMSDGV